MQAGNIVGRGKQALYQQPQHAYATLVGALYKRQIYLPIQKLEKILPNKSSLLNSR